MGLRVLKGCSLSALDILSLIVVLGFREQRAKRTFQSLGEEMDLETVDMDGNHGVHSCREKKGIRIDRTFYSSPSFCF